MGAAEFQTSVVKNEDFTSFQVPLS